LSPQASDAIVPVNSQAPGSPGQTDSVTVNGIVQANLCDSLPLISALCPDVGEVRSAAVWAQAYYWLTGGSGPASGTGNISSSSAPMMRSALQAKPWV
jgi:hypothetical protein